MGQKIIRDKCPMALEEITFTFPDPDELVRTQRKIDGRYQKVLRPRRDVKGAMVIELHCPAIDKSRPMISYNPPNPWCKKTRDICPIYEIARAVLREKGFQPSKTRIDIIEE